MIRYATPNARRDVATAEGYLSCKYMRGNQQTIGSMEQNAYGESGEWLIELFIIISLLDRPVSGCAILLEPTKDCGVAIQVGTVRVMSSNVAGFLVIIWNSECYYQAVQNDQVIICEQQPRGKIKLLMVSICSSSSEILPFVSYRLVRVCSEQQPRGNYQE